MQIQCHQAYQYGYLRSNGQVLVNNGPANITIAPVSRFYRRAGASTRGNWFFPPRPGFFVGGAIHFGYGVNLGGAWFG